MTSCSDGNEMLKPLNVVLVTHNIGRNDGQGRVNYEIVREALGAGWNVTGIAIRCDGDLIRHSQMRFIQVNVEKLPTQLLRNKAFAAASAFWIRRHRKNIDILHVNGCVTEPSADINSAHFVHGAWLKDRSYPFCKSYSSPYAIYQRYYTKINAKAELPAFLNSQIVVAVSRKVKLELESIGVPEESIAVINNGVDTNEFFPGKPERSHFGLPEEVPMFLFAGDIRTPRKNVDTILEALAKVSNSHLAVAGATLGSPFPALAVKLGVSDRVHFLGAVQEMPALMRSVDAFVFPSRYDPAGLVILEAMASGIPVLTAKTAGACEILGQGGRSLEDPNDVDTLASWMLELAENPPLRKAIGERGRIIALENQWKKMAVQYRALYIRAMNLKKYKSAALPAEPRR